MMKLSDILKDAANLVLTDKFEHSCNAVGFAYGYAKTGNTDYYFFPNHIKRGFIRMGLNYIPSAADFTVANFADCKYGEQRQNARALWLTWTALMAKEQGL